MRIENATVLLSSVRQYTEERTSKETVKARTGSLVTSTDESGGETAEVNGALLTLTRESRSTTNETSASASLAAASKGAASPAPAAADDKKGIGTPVALVLKPAKGQVEAADGKVDDVDDSLSPKLRLMKLILEKCLGVKVDLKRYHSDKDQAASQAGDQATVPASQPAATDETDASSDADSNWAISYERTDSYREAESTTFTANGTIKTADGAEIGFELSLDMSREFYAESSFSRQAGWTIDPLVINFDGNAADLTDTKFGFDLNADGTEEQISKLGQGSGFLVLDKNGDGAVNDGSELFGPETGNGFAELAGYDQDGNGWIDENDAIYSQLRIWQNNDAADPKLTTLQERKIGAIYLGTESTSFAVKNAENTLQGQVVSSSVYLGENGGVGTIQQVDLAA